MSAGAIAKPPIRYGFANRRGRTKLNPLKRFVGVDEKSAKSAFHIDSFCPRRLGDSIVFEKVNKGRALRQRLSLAIQQLAVLFGSSISMLYSSMSSPSMRIYALKSFRQGMVAVRRKVCWLMMRGRPKRHPHIGTVG